MIFTIGRSLVCRQYRVAVLLAWVTIALSSAEAQSPCVPAAQSALAVAIVGQETRMWCWAATGKMVMDFLGTAVTQCDQANKRFSRRDCCNRPTPMVCVEGGWPEFDKYGFTFKRTSDQALSWDDIRRQIHCARKPVAFSWHWTDTDSGHMMVATGYLTVNNRNYVRIVDPLPVGIGEQRVILYEALVSGSGYTHWDDFYDIQKK